MTPLKLDTKTEISEMVKHKVYGYIQNTLIFLLSLGVSFLLSVFTGYAYILGYLVVFIENLIHMPESVCPEIAFCLPSRQYILISSSIVLLQAVIIDLALIKIVKNIKKYKNKEVGEIKK